MREFKDSVTGNDPDGAGLSFRRPRRRPSRRRRASRPPSSLAWDGFRGASATARRRRSSSISTSFGGGSFIVIGALALGFDRRLRLPQAHPRLAEQAAAGRPAAPGHARRRRAVHRLADGEPLRGLPARAADHLSGRSGRSSLRRSTRRSSGTSSRSSRWRRRSGRAASRSATSSCCRAPSTC